MTTNSQTYFTLKSAAAQLGIHVQTLRNWERRGLIHMVRLPGSQYRRVPFSEIKRLQEDMDRSTFTQAIELVPPRRDETSLHQAQALAKMVEMELATLGNETTLDQLMQEGRGRRWSP